jgi:hypothetical protein
MRWGAILGAGVIVMAVAGCARTIQTDVYGWKAESADATRLTLVVLTGVDDTLVHGLVISESDSEVVVAAKVKVAGGSHVAMLVYREASVQLSKPIGERKVVNRDGSEVTHLQ